MKQLKLTYSRIWWRYCVRKKGIRKQICLSCIFRSIKRYKILNYHIIKGNNSVFNLPAMLHIKRLIHADYNLDSQVLVRGVFRNNHFVPLGWFGTERCGFNDNLKLNVTKWVRTYCRLRATTGQLHIPVTI